MADAFVDGLSDLWSAMQDVPVKIEINILRGGLRAGAIQIQQEAKSLVHNVSGDLAASIRIATGAKNGTVYSKVIAGRNKKPGDPFYAHMVEFGTAAHWIKPRYTKSLAFGGVMRDAVHHPGAQKKPFMRPAMDSKAQDGLQAMADYMTDRLPKELAKL